MISFAAVVMLCPMPLLIMYVMWRWRQDAELDEVRSAMRRLLGNGYKESRRWWLGVSLYRRFVVVLIYTQARDGVTRGVLTTVASVCFLVGQVWLEPFKERLTNVAESVSLMCLCVLCVLAAPQLSQQYFG